MRMEYDIVKSEHYEELPDMVNKLVSKGWKPQGGVCIAENGWLFQAMVRELPLSDTVRSL